MISSSGRLIAIGDIHGCVNALEAVLDAIDPQPDDHLIVLGDFVDQGRETRDVIERLIELRRRCRLDCITGNHEEMMLAARENEKALRYWENCGGVSTINSYRFGGSLADVTPNHWAFIESCIAYVETENHIFTHANVDPSLPMDQQSQYTLRWALLDADDVSPPISGKTVIVGHTEQRDGEVLDLRFIQCIDTACWRCGWLTALDVATGDVWQASRWGLLREPAEPVQRGRLQFAHA